MIGAITAGLFSAGVTPATNSYESIATVLVTSGAGQSAVSFTSIPSTFKHLQVRMYVRSGSGAYGDLRYNSDNTSTNYYAHGLIGNGAAASAVAYANAAYSPWTATTNSASPLVEILDILDYANVNKYKVSRSLSGFDNNGNGNIELTSNLWKNTNAINRIDFTAAASVFNQYSSFALYGIKG